MVKLKVGKNKKTTLANVARTYWKLAESGRNWTLHRVKKDDFGSDIVFDVVLDETMTLDEDINPVAQEIWSHGEHIGFAALASVTSERLVKLIREAYPDMTVQLA